MDKSAQNAMSGRSKCTLWMDYGITRNLLPKFTKHVQRLIVMLFHHDPIFGFGFNSLKSATRIDGKYRFGHESSPGHIAAARMGSPATPSVFTKHGASWLALVQIGGACLGWHASP
ncbi:uncharacterized protein ACN427_004907 isoform 1-T1 [Glossina fuscipes fuscipes]